MTRRWRGVLVQENVQTGDGRVIAEGAVYWADPPLPFAFLADGDQHVRPSDAPQVGTIQMLERVGNDIVGEGTLDDDNDDGAELVRRMDAGEASHGNRQLVSIDADDWEVEIVATQPTQQGDEGIVIIASGMDYQGDWPTDLPLRAAAGDPDPGPGGGPDGETLFEDAADAILERATRLRIRGAVACAVSAFDGAYIELIADEATPAQPVAASGDDAVVITGDHVEAEADEVVTAAAVPDLPPADWFADPQLTGPTPLTVTDDGRVFGHIAAWGTCHTSRQDVCTLAPRSSSDYAYFRTGETRLADNSRARTGPLTVGTGHADLRMAHRAAAAHYDDTGAAVADVAAGEDAHGIWVAGALRPSASESQVRALMASSPSGDWRSIGGGLELVAVLMVNSPGFPVPALAASGARPGAQLLMEGGECMALVAAGRVPPADPLSDLRGEFASYREESEARLGRLETAIETLGPVRLAALRERVQVNGG